MAIDEKVLAAQFDRGGFEGEDSKVSGIAQRAIDHGYSSLSAAQQAVITPFLTLQCAGATDPGDHHNGCEVALEGETLIEALENEMHYEAIVCERCRSELDYYQHQWDRISAE